MAILAKIKGWLGLCDHEWVPHTNLVEFIFHAVARRYGDNGPTQRYRCEKCGQIASGVDHAQ